MFNKIKKAIILLAIFVTVFMLHLFYYKITETSCAGGAWLQKYIVEQEYFLGVSYALSVTFMVFSFLKYKENKKNALKAGLGSGLLAVVLWFSCFFFGCCGSPMLIVYLNLFGLSTLKIPKLALLIMTVIFIGIGYFCCLKRPSKCFCNGGTCKEDEK